jgi:hypothetical protein
MISTPYSVYFHDARLQEFCSRSGSLLEYKFSTLPVLCHGASGLREIYGYQATVLVHGMRELKVSLVWHDDDYVLGARIDEREDTEADGAALLKGELLCTRFGLALGYGTIECECSRVSVELQSRDRLLESWTDSEP